MNLSLLSIHHLLIKVILVITWADLVRCPLGSEVDLGLLSLHHLLIKVILVITWADLVVCPWGSDVLITVIITAHS